MVIGFWSKIFKRNSLKFVTVILDYFTLQAINRISFIFQLTKCFYKLFDVSNIYYESKENLKMEKRNSLSTYKYVV